jgi:putative transposase
LEEGFLIVEANTLGESIFRRFFMSRVHRKWRPNAMYHITNRGNKQAMIYLDCEDNEKYLFLLQEAKKLFPFHLHAYCLMGNHYHLLIGTSDVCISNIMHYINTRYAIYFNKKYDLNGHVFQGRFNSELITDQSYFLNASRYIHLNPLEAEMVTELKDYPWSSFSSYFSSHPNPLVTTDEILSYFFEPREENYLKFLLTPIKKEAVELCRS